MQNKYMNNINKVQQIFNIRKVDIESLKITKLYCLGNISNGKAVSFCFDSVT